MPGFLIDGHILCIRVGFIHVLTDFSNKNMATFTSFKRCIQRNMGHHFNDCECSINNLVWAPLDYNIGSNIPKRIAESRLKTLETLWIRKLCSMQPWGMNYIEVDTEVRP